MPALVLVAAQLAVSYATALAPSLAGIKTYAPYFVLAAGGALCLAFNRGRALFALLALITAYAAHGLRRAVHFRAHGVGGARAAR